MGGGAGHMRMAGAGGATHSFAGRGAAGHAFTGHSTAGGATAGRATGGRATGGGRGGHVGHAVAAGVAGVAVGAAIAHGGAHGAVHAAGGQHYSPQAFPRQVSPAHQYHYQGAWRQPQGYYYRHWGYGDRLPNGWFAENYWIGSFWLYGLTPPPYDYRWVREGPDALLVNVYTGTVVEVEYGVFY